MTEGIPSVPPKRPVLAVATGPLWRLGVRDAFEVIKAAGADAVEVMVTQDTETQDALALERLSQVHDLPITAIHAPQLLLTRRVYTSDSVEKVRRTIELSRELDVDTIVLHPPYLWQVRYGLWVVHELEDALASSGVHVTMENMYPIHAGNRRLRFHRFAGLHNYQRFPHITLDTSHLAVAEEDIVEAYRGLREKVVHIHLSDNRGRGRDSHAPIGEGVLPIPEFIAALDHPALRSIALEINPGPVTEDRDRLGSILRENLEIVRSHLPVQLP